MNYRTEVVDIGTYARKRPGPKPGTRHSGQFQKGADSRRYVRERIEVGNTGRTFLELCRDTTEEALNTLLGIMRDTKAPAGDRRASAMALLDRGWGKPVESVKLEADIHTDPGDYNLMTTAELMAMFMEQRARTIDGEAERVLESKPEPPPWE